MRAKANHMPLGGAAGWRLEVQHEISEFPNWAALLGDSGYSFRKLYPFYPSAGNGAVFGGLRFCRMQKPSRRSD
jgi:hypothetical protein